MTDFETNPAGMKIPVSVIQRYEPWPQEWPTEDNNGDFVLYADHKKIVEHLEAENKRLGDLYDDTCYYHTPDGRAQFHARKIVALETALTRAIPAIDPAAIREAIARAWCHEENAAKEMDVDLAEAVLFQILALIGEKK